MNINNIFTFEYFDAQSFIKTTAEGDSGGPILAQDSNLVIGLIKSGGSGINEACANGIKTANFIDWINSTKNKYK